MKRLPLVITLVCLGAAAVLLLVIPSARADVASDGPTPTFHLTDHRGQVVTNDSVRGRVALLYFGYTYCPDVCPTELGYVGRVLKALGSSADRVEPFFVTIDPERDTPELLAHYAPFFHPRLRALSGTREELTAAWASFGVVAKRNDPLPGTQHYLMDHTSTIFILDRHGRIAARLSSHDPVAQAVTTLRSLIETP